MNPIRYCYRYRSAAGESAASKQFGETGRATRELNSKNPPKSIPISPLMRQISMLMTPSTLRIPTLNSSSVTCSRRVLARQPEARKRILKHLSSVVG